MSVLLLRLAGPLQAWGDSSRFTRRHTRSEPTKSGVLGLLAAAQGRRRADPIEDLVKLRFGVRVDQPGHLQRDFQTAHRWRDGKSMPLSYRYYLADAVFVAAVEGDRSLVDGLHEAVRSPAFPLYLGRRSCPPAGPVTLGVRDGSVEQALREADWQAAEFHRKSLSRGVIPLEAFVDSDDEPAPERAVEVVRDVPLSWSPERREYGWREVTSIKPVLVDNPDGRPPREPADDSTGLVSAESGAGSPAGDEPDFFTEVGGVPCT